jgi:hypothetical protein
MSFAPTRTNDTPSRISARRAALRDGMTIFADDDTALMVGIIAKGNPYHMIRVLSKANLRAFFAKG